MEKIRLEHLLEILSEEIWLGYRLPRKGRNPSLRERLELMEKLLQRAEICGNQITFEGKGTVQTEVMAYPYFLLEEICEIVEGVSDQISPNATPPVPVKSLPSVATTYVVSSSVAKVASAASKVA